MFSLLKKGYQNDIIAILEITSIPVIKLAISFSIDDCDSKCWNMVYLRFLEFYRLL